MPREITPIRCYHGRVYEPCPEPAAYEVLDPAPHLLCEEHARELAEDPTERDWLQIDGSERYGRICEEAASSLYRWMDSDEVNPVAHYVLEHALTYREFYELRRARAALKEAGGVPPPTEAEREFARFKAQFGRENAK